MNTTLKEQQIQNQIIAVIRAHGGWCQRINSGAIKVQDKGRQRYIKMADKGTPDILACLKGVFVGVEVKRDEKAYLNWKKQNTTTSIAQHMQKDMILESGGVYLCAYDIDQIIQDFQQLNLIS